MQVGSPGRQSDLVDQSNRQGLNLEIRTGPFFVFFTGVGAIDPFPATFSVIHAELLVNPSGTLQASFFGCFAFIGKRWEKMAAKTAAWVFDNNTF